jgi:hypothetical protein
MHFTRHAKCSSKSGLRRIESIDCESTKESRNSSRADYANCTETIALSRRRLRCAKCGSGNTPITNKSTSSSSRCKVRMSRGLKRRDVCSTLALTKSFSRLEKNCREGVSGPGILTVRWSCSSHEVCTHV